MGCPGIQASIVRHPRFGDLVKRIVKVVEEGDLSTISFVCAHGKHRSVVRNYEEVLLPKRGDAPFDV